MQDGKAVFKSTNSNTLLTFAEIQFLEQIANLASCFATFHRLPCGCCAVLAPDNTMESWQALLVIYCNEHDPQTENMSDRDTFLTWCVIHSEKENYDEK